MDYKLRNLLSSKNQILIEIIKYISNGSGWITTKWLSSELSLSKRTIQRYLNDLEELINIFSKENNQNFDYRFEKNKGIIFNQNKETNYLYLKNYIYMNDETIQLLIYLLFKKISLKRIIVKNT